MKLDEIKAKLRPIVAGCVLHGDFTLASGKKSDLYFDGRLVTLSAEGLSLLAEAVLEMIAGKNIAAVGGMAIGADPITGGVVATAGARGLKLSGFIVRKEAKTHGTGKQVEGPRPPAGARAVLLEDVVTTGGSSLKAAGCELWPVFTRKDFDQ